MNFNILFGQFSQSLKWAVAAAAAADNEELMGEGEKQESNNYYP